MLHDGGLRIRLRYELHLGPEAAGTEHGSVGQGGIANDFAGKVSKPALHFFLVGWVRRVDPVKARLRIVIFMLNRAQVDLEKYMPIVGSPLHVEFDRFIVSEAGGCGTGRAVGQVKKEKLGLIGFFLTSGCRRGEKYQTAAVGR